MTRSSHTLTRSIMMSLWLNWVLAFGSVAVTLAMGIFVPKTWLPILVLAMAYSLLVYARREGSGCNPGCVLVLRVGVLTFFWSAVIMCGILFLNSQMLLDGFIDWSKSNKEIPYIVGLIMFPLLALISLWQMMRGYRTRFCRSCQARNGFFPGNGVVSSIYSRESRYQVAIMLYISLTLAVIEWWYYAVYYININWNAPDLFFFNYMPITVIVLSVFFMLARYRNLAEIVGPIDRSERTGQTLVRFLVLSGDCLLLAEQDSGRWDTPARIDVDREKIIGDADARALFGKMVGNEDFTLRFLYSSKAHDMQTDVVHYMVTLPEGQDGQPGSSGWLNGSWLNLDRINRLLQTASLAAELADEIYRIHTITMAWKTFDRHGRRRYPIPHYRPTFRLRDFKDWDVDYSDPVWFDVMENNQDRPFFRTRRLWRRITGDNRV